MKFLKGGIFIKWIPGSLFIFSWMISVCFADLQKIEVIDAIKRKAVCNDGSPAVYYFEPGYGQGARRWVILLRGGGFCSDYACNGRPTYYLTSLDLPQTMAGGGILSSSMIRNPDFYNGNRVYIHYCSSDLWSGNRLETRGYRRMEFRGRTIFRSIIWDLMHRSEFHLSETGTEILFAGWSAGGLGVLVNLDWLASQLPHAKVRGLNDAGWLPDEAKSVQTLKQGIAQGIPIWGGQPDQDCMRDNQRSKSKCYLSTVLPYITTPLFIQESQRDPTFTVAYPSAFGKELRKSLVHVEAAFSPRTETHELAPGDGFQSVKINGYSLADVLGNWFFDRAGPIKVIKK